jgi:hypothetical protein
VYSRGDVHDTPWGARPGSELVAMAIEQLFQPEALHHLATPAKWLAKIVLALAIALIHHFMRPIAATIATLVVLPVSVVVLAEVLSQLGSYEVGVVAFGVGILIEQLVGGAERAEHLAHHAERAHPNGVA